MEFLEQTIEGLSSEGRAGIGLIFLNGGIVRSPIDPTKLATPAIAFDAKQERVRHEIEALNGSILNLAEDEDGPYWTYRHPTIGDAFALHVAKSPELVELYLRGAKPETIVGEVVCAGVRLRGASVVVPSSLADLLVDRIASLNPYALTSFISSRANKSVAKNLMKVRPDLRKRIEYFTSPLRDDIDVDFFLTLWRYGLIAEEERQVFVESIRRNATQDADDSFLEVDGIANVLTRDERAEILNEVKNGWFGDIPGFVDHLRGEWDEQYSPDDYFHRFQESVKSFSRVIAGSRRQQQISAQLDHSVNKALQRMWPNYEESPSVTAPIQQSAAKKSSIEELFRDVDN
jgi:hypothetical protein